MKKMENRYIHANWFARIAAIMLAAVLAISYLPATRAYAAKDKTDKSKTSVAKAALDSEPSIREVHKVKVGKKRYCFFVTHNVVMTPAEIAQFGDDDEKLTDEVLKRAGLYIKEENCKLASHKVISPEDWKKMGGTLSLSQVEIYEPDEEEVAPSIPAEEKKDDTTETSDAGNTSDTGNTTDTGNTSDTGNTTDTGNTGESGNDGNTSDSSNTGDNSGENGNTDDTSGNATNTDNAGDTNNTSDTGNGTAAEGAAEGRIVKVEAVEALRKAAPTDGDPARFYMDLIITTETPKEGSAEQPKKYSTFKKSSPNSPKLIYLAVATEEDAKLGEDICEIKNGSSKNNGTNKQKMPSLRETGEDDDEMLPEFRSISMTDRSGEPLEPTLKDGDPVTLEWKEPGRQTDAEGGSGFFEQKWAIPALGGVALLLAAALVFILRKRRETETEEE